MTGASPGPSLRRLRSLVLGDTVTQVGSVIWTSGSILVAQILLAANGLFSARLLGPGGKGVSAAVLTWMQLLIWGASAPLSIAELVNVPRRCDDGDFQSECVAQALGNAVIYVSTVGVVVAGVAAITLPRTLSHLGSGASSLTLLALATVPLGMFGTIAAAVQLALGRRSRFNAAQVANPVVMTAVVFWFAATSSLTPGNVVVAAVAGTVAAAAVVCRGLPWRKLAVDLHTMRSDLRFGFKAHLGSLFRLTNLRLDYLVMSAVVPAKELGLYATANNLLLPLFTLPTAVSTLLAVKVARASLAEDETGEAASRQLAMIRAEAFRYSVLSVAGGVALGLMGWLVVPLILGDTYRGTVGLVWLLLPGSVLLCYTTIATAGAVSMNKVWVGVASEAAAAIVTVSLLPILLPSWRAAGAATTSSIAYAVSAAVAAAGLAVMRRNMTKSKTVVPD